jgi:hypothetical protein
LLQLFRWGCDVVLIDDGVLTSSGQRADIPISSGGHIFGWGKRVVLGRHQS